ncbi:MAG: hypothetical protein IK057_04950 [Clostridia bacterium]|nr:hypothetical protein [Clostridia bacterium]
MEIGSFIELQFPKGLEYYKGDKDIARLNTGRAGIWHGLTVLGCDTVWIPHYQCDSVRDFLNKKGVKIKYYSIDREFNPIDLTPQKNEAVLFVNYFGIMSKSRMESLAKSYKNAIIDNSQAFFAPPLDTCMNVYSCRKFVGVPDGAYVLGKNADKKAEEYDECHSSDTSLFMLQRIEYGCEGKAYETRQKNENRIENEDCLKMSKLTRTILDGTDYEVIKKKRVQNFAYAKKLFDKLNRLDVSKYYDDTVVPMVYPLLIEDTSLLYKLLDAKHFQGHWWNYLLKETDADSFEHYLSEYMIPITIDQRYGKEELDYLYGIIAESEDNKV